MLEYDRAVWNEFCADVWPGLKTKWRVPIEAPLAAGLAYAAYRVLRMEVAADYAAKSAIGIVGCLAAFIFIHLGVSWATAPRRLFFRQQKQIKDLRQRELDREKLQGLLNVLDEMHALRNDIARSNQGVIEWCAKRDALKIKVRDTITEISEVDARNFLLVTHVPPMSHAGCQSQGHSDMITEVIMLIERLQTLIDRYSAALEAQSRMAVISA